MPYERILLPVADEPDEAVLTNAIRLSDSPDASVHVLYVVDERRFPDPSPLYDDGTSDTATDELQAHYEREGERAIRTVEEALSERLPEGALVTHIERGVPADVIRHYADQNDIDAIVMATHDRTTPQERLLGSVTERVIRAGAVPVFVIPPSITAKQ